MSTEVVSATASSRGVQSKSHEISGFFPFGDTGMHLAAESQGRGHKARNRASDNLRGQKVRKNQLMFPGI